MPIPISKALIKRCPKFFRVAHTYRVKSVENSKSQVYSSLKQISRAVTDEKVDMLEFPRVVMATLIKRMASDSGKPDSSNKKHKVADKVKAIDGAKTFRITDGSGQDIVDKHAKLKNKACFAFSKEGKCDRGTTCWFKH